MPKLNYAAMFTLRKDGRYQGYWHEKNGKRHAICDRDPEQLYHKIIAKEVETPPLSFEQAADAWANKHWDRIGKQTLGQDRQ